MPYSYIEGQGLWLTGVHTNPILIISTISGNNSMEAIVSYLNEQEKMFDNWRMKTQELLKCSLECKAGPLAKIQDEVSKMLNFPGVVEFAKEKIHKVEKSGSSL